jgi:N-acetylglucosamine-6-phosphate deacetylase
MIDFCARRYDNGEPVRVFVDGNRIAAVEPVWPSPDTADWPCVAPGLFDLQINGYRGVWFSDEGLTPEQVLTVLEAHFHYGVTRLCPTLITNSHAALCAGFRAIRAACEREPWADRMVAGCHLEGPYISAEEGPVGAHPREHVRPCDWDEFAALQEAAGGRIRLVTLAPESAGAVGFIRRAVAAQVTIAIGHTAATGEQIDAAVAAGARLSTHLGNGAHAVLRRHPNYIWDQLGDVRLWASMITDGHHLPASVVRSIVRTKGLLRTIITCDAAGLAGNPPGIYEHHGSQFEVLPDGRIVVAAKPEYLAGSARETDACVARAAEMTGLPLAGVWDMASHNPARLLNLELVRLARGSRADLAVFDYDGPGSEIRMRATLASGTPRFGHLPAACAK